MLQHCLRVNSREGHARLPDGAFGAQVSRVHLGSQRRLHDPRSRQRSYRERNNAAPQAELLPHQRAAGRARAAGFSRAVSPNRLSPNLAQPLVGVIMGSKSDWETMQHAADMLKALGVPFETQVVSAHRTPDLLREYATKASDRGIEVIIAGAGGSAHLPGMTAANTILPVLGVPVESKALQGIDSLLSIVQMPAGVPVGTLAIGKPGAINAALLAASIVARNRPEVRERLRAFRDEAPNAGLAQPDPAATE